VIASSCFIFLLYTRIDKYKRNKTRHVNPDNGSANVLIKNIERIDFNPGVLYNEKD